MPLTDAELAALLERAAAALDDEAGWLVDVDFDDRGREKPSIPPRDRDFFDAVTEQQARSLRDLVRMIRARQAR